MHISHIQGPWFPRCTLSIPSSVCVLEPDWCILWNGNGYLEGASSHQSVIYWTEQSEEVSNQSLTEVSAQSGWTVVHSELDEGVQEVPVQIGELLTWTHLFQVVRGNHQEVTEGVECVKELQHQRDLEDRHKKALTPYERYTVHILGTTALLSKASCPIYC